MKHANAFQPTPISEQAEVISFNPTTGDLVPTPVIQRNRSPKYITEPYLLMFKAGLKKLSHDPNMHEQEFRVFIELASELDIGTDGVWKSLNLADLARELGMKPQNVSVVLKKLAAKGVITKGCRIGRGTAYKMNPMVGWCGPAKHWPKAAKEAKKLTLIEGGIKKQLAPEPVAEECDEQLDGEE